MFQLKPILPLLTRALENAAESAGCLTDQISVHSIFPQLWGSTALGFGGVGGQACTNAYTLVLRSPEGAISVYFNDRLAYRIEGPNSARPLTVAQAKAFAQDLAARYLVSVRESGLRYGADSE